MNNRDLIETIMSPLGGKTSIRVSPFLFNVHFAFFKIQIKLIKYKQEPQILYVIFYQTWNTTSTKWKPRIGLTTTQRMTTIVWCIMGQDFFQGTEETLSRLKIPKTKAELEVEKDSVKLTSNKLTECIAMETVEEVVDPAELVAPEVGSNTI